MEQERYIIPRNVINSDDTFPFDFITHIEIEKRQIPYLIVGVGVAAMAMTSKGSLIPIQLIVNGNIRFLNFTFSVESANIISKAVMGMLSFGSAFMLSTFKIENQYLEQLLNNFIKYNKSLIEFKCERGAFNAKNFKGRIPKFAVKK